MEDVDERPPSSPGAPLDVSADVGNGIVRSVPFLKAIEATAALPLPRRLESPSEPVAG
jgi:hypothetical protein